MKSLFTVLAIAGLAAAAESSSNATSPSSPIPYKSSKIPSSVSQGCSTFLTSLNTASGMQSCVKPVLDALTSNDTSSLGSVCSAINSQGCSDTLIRTWLTDFKGNCSSELTSNNKDVIALYDVLYIVKPFGNAVCSKDESDKYCLSQLASNSSSRASSGLKNAAQTPLTSSDGTPDAEAFSNANILWLGANPEMDASALCTTCTKNVLTSYVAWESSMPPATGLAGSPLLSSQGPLWTSVQKTCPADFISGTLANAGASPGAANGASSSSPAKGAALMLGLVAAGVMTL